MGTGGGTYAQIFESLKTFLESNVSKDKLTSAVRVVTVLTTEERSHKALCDNLERLGDPPDHFDDELSKIWYGLAELTAQSIKLEPAYRILFELFCRSYQEYQELDSQLKKEGYCYVSSSAHTDKMARKHPLFAMRCDVEKRLANLAEEFGLSPHSKSEFPMFKAADENPAAKYF